MIGYRTIKIILKLPPFWIMNEELQEREIQNQMKTKTKTFCFHLMFWIFPLLIFLIQSAERREFRNNFSSSVPYHIQPWLCLESIVIFIFLKMITWGQSWHFLGKRHFHISEERNQKCKSKATSPFHWWKKDRFKERLFHGKCEKEEQFSRDYLKENFRPENVAV